MTQTPVLRSDARAGPLVISQTAVNICTLYQVYLYQCYYSVLGTNHFEPTPGWCPLLRFAVTNYNGGERTLVGIKL